LGGYSVGIPPVPVVDANGNVVTNVLNVTGNVSVANVYAGNYFYANGQPFNAGGNPLGPNFSVQYNNNGVFGGNSAFLYDNANSLVTVPSLKVNGLANLGPVGNVTITGGSTGYLLTTDGNGVLQWSPPGSGAAISNGSSNVNIATASGNVTVGINGVSNVVTITSNSVVVAGNVNATNFNGNVNGNITGNFNGNVTGTLTGNVFGNVLGTVVGSLIGNATTAGTVVTNAQPNITSVGTLTALSVTGNANVGTLLTNSIKYANGDPYVFTTNAAGTNTQVQFNNNSAFGASANFTFDNSTNTLSVTNIVANGSGLTSLTGANVTGAVSFATTANAVAGANVSGAVNFATTANAVAGANVSGAVSFATTANSVDGANVSGAVAFATTANSVAVANVTGIGNIATVNLDGNAGNILFGNGTFAAVPNVANVANANYANFAGEAFSVNVSNIVGTVNLANFATTANAVAGANVSGAVANATYALNANVANTANTAGTVTTNAQPNITSVGTLTGLTVAGDILPSANLTYDLGSPTLRWKDLYVSGNTIDLNGSTISSDANGVTLANPAGGTFTVIGTGASNTAAVVNGNSSIVIQPNSEIDFNVTGTSNIVIISSDGLIVNSNANVTGNIITAGNVTANGNVIGGNLTTANGVYANTANITANLTSGNANLGNLATANYVNIANILSGNIANFTGNLTSLNANLGNLATANYVNIANVLTGNIANFSGNLTSLNADLGNLATANYVNIANILSGNIANFSGNLTAGNANLGNLATASYITGTLTTNAQPNITSVGTLTSLNVSGNANTANLGTNNFIATGTGSFGANINMNSQWINNVGYPNLSTDAASKAYVDTLVSSGVSYHQPVLAATTTTLATATGGTTAYNEPGGAGVGVGAYISTTGTFLNIDGANVQTVGTRILVKDEANASWNGVYTYANTTAIVRSTDADEYGTGSTTLLGINDFFFTTGGTVNEGVGFIVSAPSGEIIFGTSLITFSIFITAQVYDAGTGLTLTGTTFSVNPTQTQITEVGTLTGLTSTGTVNLTNASNVSLGPVANVHISGGNSSYVLSTDGSGNLSWVEQAGGSSINFISNGNSNVFVNANGNVTTSVAGNANIFTVTGTGANVSGTFNTTGLVTIPNTAGGATAIAMGSPTQGNLVSNALTLTTSSSVSNAIAQLNVILGKLVPPSPPNFPASQSITVQTLSTFRMANYVQTDNTPGANKSVAGGTTVSTVRRASSYSTGNITVAGPGDSGTITAYLNGSDAGNRTLTTALNGNGTYSNLVIFNNYDYNVANANIAAGFWSVFSSRTAGTVTEGWNEVFIADSATSNTNTTSWFYDSSNPGTPAFSTLTISPPGSPSYTYSSTVPHYNNTNIFTLTANVNRLSGNMYPTSDSFVTGTSGGAFGTPSSVTYSAAGVTTPLAQNLYVSSGNASISTTSTIISGFGASSTGPSLSSNNSYNSNTQAFTSTLAANVLYKTGTVSSASVIEEANVFVGTTIGVGSGLAFRIINPGSTDNPVYTANAAAFNSQSSTLQTYDSTVVANILKHDQTNYSTGYLPAGPDLSSGRTGSQYFTFKIVRTSVSKFDVKWTGTIAGLWVALPGSTIDSTSSANGWIDMSVAYAGAGIPGVNSPGNGSDGCALGGVAPLNSAQTNKSVTATFGTVSSSSTATNEIYIRIKLTSGQSVTALSLQTASN
jgi:hypothetical protein